MSTYETYANKTNSEKITLVTMEASNRLIEWSVYSGSVYVYDDFDITLIVEIADSGTALTESATLAGVSAGKYYHDKSNKKLYLQTSDSANPDGKFISLRQRLFFSDAGVSIANDLSTGFDVHWRGLLVSDTLFGVALDNKNQLGLAIEGSGNIKFLQDTFWTDKFDKLTWQNKLVKIYSWNQELPVTEAKLIYRGRVQSKAWSSDNITFQLKDLFNELRAKISLTNIEDVGGAVVPDGLKKAKKRLIYGEVSGFRPTPVDHILDGLSLAGTVSITAASQTLTGSGTSFLSKLSPEDQIIITDLDDAVTIESIQSDVSATLSEAANVSLSTKTYKIDPNLPKRYAMRDWILSNHALREPSTTVSEVLTLGRIRVVDDTDLNEGNTIWLNSQLLEIRSVSENEIRFVTNMNSAPAAGTAVTRLTVPTVYHNADTFQYNRDYTYSAASGTLTLNELAEFNIAPIRRVLGTSMTFTNTSRDVTGSGTFFTTQLTPNSWVRASTQSAWFEVLQINSDTSLTLRTASTYTATTTGLFKDPKVFDESNDVLSCEVMGGTENGTTSGVFIKDGPQIVKDLLTKAGLSSEINTSSFTTAQTFAKYTLGMAVPAVYTATDTITYRDAINQVNRSIFGALTQNADFELAYNVINPIKPATTTRIRREDVLGFTVASSLDKTVKTVNLKYTKKEYDVLTADSSESVSSHSSNEAEYLGENTKEKDIDTLIRVTSDADILASRWSFFLALAQSIIKFKSKLQVARLNVTDKIDFEHTKLYERLGSANTRKIGAISSAKKSGTDTNIEIEDIANALTRCATFTASDAATFVNASDDEKIMNGYFTNSFGYILGREDYGLNLFW
jgi:hypothetical protein